MTRDQLEHLLRAASRIAGERDVIVIGSQAILGSVDDRALPDEAIGSIEADVCLGDDPFHVKSDLVERVSPSRGPPGIERHHSLTLPGPGRSSLLSLLSAQGSVHHDDGGSDGPDTAALVALVRRRTRDRAGRAADLLWNLLLRASTDVGRCRRWVSGSKASNRQTASPGTGSSFGR